MTVIAAMSAQATIPVDQAVGMVLPHDITEIVRDSFKGRAFKKGHIIREQDVDHLRRLGKEHIYVLRLGPDEIHENEAALQLAAALAGSGVGYGTEVVEGKVSLRATADGLLRVDREALFRFNLLGEVMCATLQDHTPVRAMPSRVTSSGSTDMLPEVTTSLAPSARHAPMAAAIRPGSSGANRTGPTEEPRPVSLSRSTCSNRSSMRPTRNMAPGSTGVP